MDLLRTLPDSEDLLVRLCARCAASMDEINLLHSQVGSYWVRSGRVMFEHILGEVR